MKKILILALLCTFIACTEQKKNHAQQTTQEILKPAHSQKSLFFTGTIQPIQEIAIISPTDAVVETMVFEYGQIVPKNASILTLNAPELQKRFNEALTDYLKAKENFRILQSKFSGTKELWQAGIISKNNYLSEQSGLSTARISLIQTQKKLDDILQLTNTQRSAMITDLNLSDYQKISQTLSHRHQHIDLKAPFEGMLLYPKKSLENKDERIRVGSALKSNQVLAFIGNLTGLHIEIQIPETDINKVHSGMPAIIHTLALGDNHALQGQVIAVNAQAASSQNGLPSFSALVEVKKLSKEEQTQIKVGMSATIELRDDQVNQLTVPIQAVHLRHNKTYVSILNKNNQVEERLIVTGRADPARVAVIKGLKAGEVIVYDA